MSNHYGKQQLKSAPKEKMPWALLAVVAALALIVTGAVVLARPGQSSAGSGATSGAGPKVAVYQDILDFGKVKMSTPVTAAFRIKNEGNAPLQIVGQPQVRVVEGC